MNEQSSEESFDLPKLFDILRSEGKISAIKFIVDNSDYSLKDAKDFVDKIEGGDGSAKLTSSRSQRVTTTRENGKITLKYYDGNNPGVEVKPSDALWARVKELMGDKPMMREYENQFDLISHAPKSESDETNLSNFDMSSGSAPKALNMKTIISAILIILLIIFLVFKLIS